MTIDDESSVYVGGLPYNATEDSLRRVFDVYGAVVAVKVLFPRQLMLSFFLFFLSFVCTIDDMKLVLDFGNCFID